MKTAKPRRTKNSASMTFSSARRSVDGAGHAARVGGAADQPLDDGAGGVAGDGRDIRHRRRAVGGDARFGLGQLGGEIVLQRLAFGVAFGGDLVARGLRGRLGVGAGEAELLLVV